MPLLVSCSAVRHSALGGPYRQASASPARHRPGARSARRHGPRLM